MLDKKAVVCATSAEPVKKGIDDLVQQAMTDDAFLTKLTEDPEIALKENGYPSDEGVVARIKKIDFAGLRDAFLVNPAASLPYC